MWHVAIQERQLEGAQKSALEEEAAGRKHLREQAAKQLRREEAASEKAERNRLLRVRWVVRACGRGGSAETGLSPQSPAPARGPAGVLRAAPPPAGPDTHFSFPFLLWLLPRAQTLQFPGCGGLLLGHS